MKILVKMSNTRGCFVALIMKMESFTTEQIVHCENAPKCETVV